MPRHSTFVLALFATAIITLSAAHAEEEASSKNWNNFRGPTLNGVSDTAKPPTKWSATENVHWKMAIPGRGTASPVVWGCLLYTSPSPRDATLSRMPSSA